MDHNKNNDHFAKRVLERISDERLVPRPRWEFIFKNYFFWGLGALAVVFGALAFSAAIFEVQNVDWRLGSVTHSDFFSFFLAAAPFLWVGTLIALVLVGYVNVRRTNHGYRYPLVLIALGAVLTSMTLGTALYATGFGGEVEDVAGDFPPFHQSILNEVHSWWLAPEKGLLGGEVVSMMPDNGSFILSDFSGASWTVDGSDLRTPDLAVVARGGAVRLVGVPTTATSSVFHACFALPLEPRGSFRRLPPPLPLAGVASTSERSPAMMRSEVCKDIRPYQQLRDINEVGF